MTTVLFESSFEVGNMVGGIHTVLATKAEHILKYVEQYFLIGPYFHDQAKKEFKELPIPQNIQPIIAELEQHDIIAHYGEWMVPGNPKTFLLEFQSQFTKLNAQKKELYDKFQVESLGADYDVSEPMAFSLAAAKLIQAYTRSTNCNITECDIISQTHEWMTGYINLFLKQTELPIRTVFTTHATILGRTLSTFGWDRKAKNFNPDEKAKEFNIIQKHSAEKASAKYSDVFTTVSDTTGEEATFILGKKPDILTYNGIPYNTFPDLEKIQTQHLKSRKQLFDFLQYYFFPYHTFDTTKTRIVFTSGRHEVHNKGIDITIDALGKLNKELKEQQSEQTVIAFIWVPYETYGVMRELLEQKITFEHINQQITEIIEHQERKIFQQLAEGKKGFIDLSGYTQLQHVLEPFKRKHNNAPISTHYVKHNEIHDKLSQAGLANNPDDKVKIVYYPTYLDKFDNLLDMDYYQTIIGTDLGIFPSFYEPWGYTPAESIAVGVPAITSNLAGFGQYMKNSESVTIIERTNDHQQEVEQLYKAIKAHITLTNHQLARLRTLTKLNSEQIDWAKLVKYYLQAYNLQ